MKAGSSRPAPAFIPLGDQTVGAKLFGALGVLQAGDLDQDCHADLLQSRDVLLPA